MTLERVDKDETVHVKVEDISGTKSRRAADLSVMITNHSGFLVHTPKRVHLERTGTNNREYMDISYGCRARIANCPSSGSRIEIVYEITPELYSVS